MATAARLVALSGIVVRAVVMLLMALVAAGVVAAVASAATVPRFSAPVILKTGPGAETLFANDLNVLAADVNGDSNPDLVAATFGAVSVLYGHGDGSFRRRAYRVRAPVDVAVGDVSGDGRPDLVAVGTYEGEFVGFVVVFINDGAERFHRAGVYTIKGDAVAVDVGDFNGDGTGDVVVEGLYGDFVILLAAGDGRLTAPRIVSGRGGRHLTVGDFNGDGRLDVALAALSSRSVRVRLGVGDGSFGPAGAFGVARDDAVRVSTADLNNDSALDLVVTRDLGSLGVLLGNNDGTFDAQTNYRMGDPGYPTGQALVGDFDGDHIGDVAAGSYGYPTPVRLGVGDGTFQQRRALPRFSTFTYAVDEYPGTGAVADFNRDGRLDIAVVAVDAVVDRDPRWIAVLLNWTGLHTRPCVVTPVTHEPLRAARRHLANAGCRVGRARYQYSRSIRRGRVISQRPSYGALLPARTPVNVVVSRGRLR